MSNTSVQTERARLETFLACQAGREVVVVQGLGFVGGAMVAALSKARQPGGRPRFAVIGLDLNDVQGRRKAASVQEGVPPIKATDPALAAAFAQARSTGNLTGTTDPEALGLADIIVMDVNYDVLRASGDAANYEVAESGFYTALREVAERVREGALVVVETTVPPGTTKRLVAPTIAEGMRARGLDPARVQIAHSYERVMPGPDYLASITDFHRVFAGQDPASAVRARAFLESFINTRDFPLSELESPTASETAKVLENSFRATNIALIQEWSEYAQAAEIDLWRIIRAIRIRPTHRNIMAPGFGVGGYCLTKDGLLADWGARQVLGPDFRLGMTLRGIDINDAMPRHTLQLLRDLLPDLAGRRVLVLGVTYLADVADTRYSPTATFCSACQDAGARVLVHDPIVTYWPEADIEVNSHLEGLAEDGGPDALVFAVRHREYSPLDAAAILRLFPRLAAAVDGNDVLSDATAAALAKAGVRVAGVGKGHWRQLNGPAK